jgi:glutamyl-tRNA reductase
MTGAALDRVYAGLARRWMGGHAAARALLAAMTRREGADAARHLLRVAAGLESQVLGDGQVLGQVRGAYRLAAETGAAGSVLHRLFDTALRAGKRVHSETPLSLGRTSIGAAAAALAARRFGSLHRARVVVVGTGKTGQRVARQLVKLGARDLVLINRTRAHADALTAEVRGRSAPFETLHCELAMADVAIVATGAGAPIVRTADLATARDNCATTGLPLLMLDLAMPRNIEPEVVSLDGVALIDLDAMHLPVAATERSRQEAIPAAERIVDTELATFHEWLASASARSAIRPLHDALVDLCRREVAFAAGPAVADRTAERIVAKFIARPMSAVRRAIDRGESIDELTGVLTELFTPPAGERV